ncbi:MAG: hypothetical protein APF76_13300 [Desulfitibacter sp. BRH_c19]|nr:MAG: hypothetical protein APF76_13300 [Desulfitibacter sp. BRH_c19]
MAQVELKNIKKNYGDVTVVHDFNLLINDQEFLVLVGPSGCGKSTTLRMIAGLEEITAGELYIDNKLVNDILPKDRDIAMVFQNYALYPHMSVYENLAFALKLRKMSKPEIEKNVQEAAKILNLEDYLHRKPKALSGGQRQRVALGRAIVRHPKVFLMDEPLSNLDAKLRVHMRTEISKLHKRLGATIVYVTHDQTEAMTMGDRIVVMKDGYIQQVDTPLHLYNTPANMFVAGFIGSPAMNFLPVMLKQEGEQLIVEGEKWQAPVLNNWHEALNNSDLVLGVRPEDIRLGLYTEGARAFGLVEVIEPMGAETYVYVNLAGKTIIARVEANLSIKTGDKVTINFITDKLHLFNGKSEQTIFNGSQVK